MFKTITRMRQLIFVFLANFAPQWSPLCLSNFCIFPVFGCLYLWWWWGQCSSSAGRGRKRERNCSLHILYIVEKKASNYFCSGWALLSRVQLRIRLLASHTFSVIYSFNQANWRNFCVFMSTLCFERQVWTCLPAFQWSRRRPEDRSARVHANGDTYTNCSTCRTAQRGGVAGCQTTNTFQTICFTLSCILSSSIYYSSLSSSLLASIQKRRRRRRRRRCMGKNNKKTLCIFED